MSVLNAFLIFFNVVLGGFFGFAVAMVWLAGTFNIPVFFQYWLAIPLIAFTVIQLLNRNRLQVIYRTLAFWSGGLIGFTLFLTALLHGAIMEVTGQALSSPLLFLPPLARIILVYASIIILFFILVMKLTGDL